MSELVEKSRDEDEISLDVGTYALRDPPISVHPSMSPGPWPLDGGQEKVDFIRNADRENGSAYPEDASRGQFPKIEDVFRLPSYELQNNVASYHGFQAQSVVDTPNSSAYEIDSDLDPRVLTVASANMLRFPPQRPGDTPFQFEEERRLTVERMMNIASEFNPYSTGPLPEELSTEHQKESEISRQLRGNTLNDSNASLEVVDAVWRSLSRTREDVKAIRDILQKNATRMKRVRQESAVADNLFMTQARRLLLGRNLQAIQKELVRRAGILQSLREEMHQTEAENEKLEAQLSDANSLMESLELDFWRLLTKRVRNTDHGGNSESNDSKSHQAPRQEVVDKSPYVPDDLRGISPHGPEDQLHPLMRDLLKAIADRRNYQEEYSDLLRSKELHDDELLSLNLQKADDMPRRIREFRQNFPVLQKSMKTSLNESSTRAVQLETACREKDIWNRRYEVEDGRVVDNFYVGDTDDLKLEDLNMEKRDNGFHRGYSEILSQGCELLLGEQPLTPYVNLREAFKLPDNIGDKQGSIKEAVKAYEIERLVTTQPEDDDSGKFGFVQRWLLQQLRLSQLQVSLLRWIFTTTQNLKIFDLTQWQVDVLYFWFRDDLTLNWHRFFAAEMQHSLYSTGSSVQRPGLPASELNMRQEFGKGHFNKQLRPSPRTIIGNEMRTIRKFTGFKGHSITRW